MKREQGSALIVVTIVVVAIMGLLAAMTQFSIDTSRHVYVVNEFTNREYAAEAGLERIKVLSMEDKNWLATQVTENNGTINWGDGTSFEIDLYTVSASVQSLGDGWYLVTARSTDGQNSTAVNATVRSGALYWSDYARFVSDNNLSIGSNAYYGGKVHSNGNIYCNGSNIRFMGEVTAGGSINPRSDTSFYEGRQSNVDRIDLPHSTEIGSRIETMAKAAGVDERMWDEDDPWSVENKDGTELVRESLFAYSLDEPASGDITDQDAYDKKVNLPNILRESGYSPGGSETIDTDIKFWHKDDGSGAANSARRTETTYIKSGSNTKRKIVREVRLNNYDYSDGEGYDGNHVEGYREEVIRVYDSSGTLKSETLIKQVDDDGGVEIKTSTLTGSGSDLETASDSQKEVVTQSKGNYFPADALTDEPIFVDGEVTVGGDQSMRASVVSTGNVDIEGSLVYTDKNGVPMNAFVDDNDGDNHYLERSSVTSGDVDKDYAGGFTESTTSEIRNGRTYTEADDWDSRAHQRNNASMPPTLGIKAGGQIYLKENQSTRVVEACLMSCGGLVRPSGQSSKRYNLYINGSIITTGTNPLSGTFRYRTYAYDPNLTEFPPTEFEQEGYSSEFSNWHMSE